MARSLDQKKLNEVSKPLHPSTNPEILVKIAPLASELRGLESQPLKILFLNKEKTSAKYIALPASLPSGLNQSSSGSCHSKIPKSKSVGRHPCTSLHPDLKLSLA